MIKRFAKVALSMLAGVVMAGQAIAAPQGGNFEVSPFVGYYWLDGDSGYKDHVVWGGRFGYLYNDNLEAEVAVAAVRTDIAGSHREYADLRQLQADVLYNFTGFGKLVPYAAAGIGGVHFDPAADGDKDAAFLVDYGVGARYFFTDNLAARVDLRQPIFSDGSESNFMATVGVSYFFGFAKPPVKVAEAAPAPEPIKVVAPAPAPVKPADSDGDGVVDSDDRCPGTPAGVKVDVKGCPVDSDGDGVADYLDQCPGTPAGAKVDAKGCPVDTDGDGVADYLDKCPGTPAGVKVDANGCPVDTDGDGVADYLDKCPGTPAGAPVDETGCLKDSDRDGLSDWDEMKLGTDPHNPDTDADGLNDGDEVHKYHTNPLNADTDGGSVNDGLEVNVAHTNPLDPSDDVKEVKRIALKVYFDNDSDVVKPAYFPEIEQVASFLKEYPEVNGAVEGHTDNRGQDAYNQKLSERRAKSVVKVAQERFGVPAGRLSAVGFGEARPVADNKSGEGRAKNRRIEAAFTSR